MPTATLTSKGQLTLPKEIRDELGLDAGDKVLFRRNEQGEIVLEAATVDLLSLAGMVKPRVKGVTVDDMKDAVRRGGTRR